MQAGRAARGVIAWANFLKTCRVGCTEPAGILFEVYSVVQLWLYPRRLRKREILNRPGICEGENSEDSAPALLISLDFSGDGMEHRWR